MSVSNNFITNMMKIKINKKNNLYVLAAISLGGTLIILTIIFFLRTFLPSKKEIKPPITPISENINKKDERYPDPFSYPLEKKEGKEEKEEFFMSAPKDLSLEGLLRQEKKIAVIINDMIVREGDVIGEKKVLEIKDESVVLEDTNYQYILTFKEE